MKHVLLIAGGGTLGTKTSDELLRLGYRVDVLCPEDKESCHHRLTFYKGLGDEQTLKQIFAEKRYDSIVNFIHYSDIENYKPMHKLLRENTQQLIFLSSYRVYADEQHPITESAPQLIDVSKDKDFLKKETYAVRKSMAERFILGEGGNENVTVIRPVISFSHRRFDLLMYSNKMIVNAVQEGRTLLLPEKARKLTAGLDWSGNSGKLIANLVQKEAALGESFTISSAQNLNWGQVADIFAEVAGLKTQWVEEQDYLDSIPAMNDDTRWRYLYDRLYDRLIDNSKVLQATGLEKQDFLPIEEGLKIELETYYKG